MHPLPLIPMPNGTTQIEDRHIALPAVLRVDAGPFGLEFLEVFALRAGIALTLNKPAFLHIARDESLASEEYHLLVREDGIRIGAGSERGLCWALATLAALAGDGGVPCCDIADAPQYAHRGFMMDCARHFFPAETVKAMIELASLAKLNVFHWHLTDDQGWRIESRVYLALHGQHTPEQGAPEYYAQDEIREIVAFARARGVEVIPEIDLPGHAGAILSAYPQLSCTGRPVRLTGAPGIRAVILCPGKDEVFEFLYPLLDEIAGLFPSRRIHIGGDEAPKGEWRKCPDCQQRMEEEGLAAPEDLQGWFTARVADYLRIRAKQCVCWNESLQAANLRGDIPDIAIQYWAEVSKAGSAKRFWKQGGGLIFSEQFRAYLDFSYGTVTLKRAYRYQPGLPGFRGKGLPALGLEACLWSEFVDTPQRLALQAFPRLYAIAEAAWTHPQNKSYANFRERLSRWLGKNPGIGFTQPEDADPRWLARRRGQIGFLRGQKNALKPEENAGVGGPVHWRYLLRWVKNYLC